MKFTNKKTTFNYRVYRAIHCIECDFNLLSMRLRVLERAIATFLEKADIFVKAIRALHDMIIDKERISLDELLLLNGVKISDNTAYSKSQAYPIGSCICKKSYRYTVHIRESFIES